MKGFERRGEERETVGQGKLSHIHYSGGTIIFFVPLMDFY